MTNEDISRIIRTIDITNATELKKGEAVLVRGYDKIYRDIEFIILLENGVRVGGIYIMGDVDLHIYTLEEHRNKGHMSKFFKSKILNEIRPNLTSISSSEFFCGEYIFSLVRHLAEVGDFHFREDDDEIECRPSQKKDISELVGKELELEILKQRIEGERRKLRIFKKFFNRANQINEHFKAQGLCYSIVNHLEFYVIRPRIDFLKEGK